MNLYDCRDLMIHESDYRPSAVATNGDVSVAENSQTSIY